MNHPQTTFTPLTKVILGVFVVLLVTGPLYFAAAQSTRLDNGGNQIVTPTTPTVPIGPSGFPSLDAAAGISNSTGPTQANIVQSDGSVKTAIVGDQTDSSYTPDKETDNNFFGESTLKSILYFIVVNFFGTLLGWAGNLLDYGINNFVIGFGTSFNNQGVGEAVNDLWGIVRDLFNILFIFGFIYIGFQMILDSSNTAARRTLVTLLMAALLVNFSLFISKFVVDFSNRLASEVAVAAFPASGNAVGNIADADVNVQISERQVKIADTFFAHMGIARTLDVSGGIRNNEDAAWSYIFGSAIFYLIGTFVFAAGGVMLIIRFVALSIFMVLSPFMFLGWIFPGMQSWTQKYWTGFLGRAFYAPVYLILLFFAGSILQKFFTKGSGSMQNRGLVEGITSGSLSDILGPFILSCVFLIAAVQVAGKMSADGAGAAVRIGGNMAKGLQKRTLQAGGALTAGMAARTGRTVIGLPANAFINSDLGKNVGSRGWAGRQIFKAAQTGAKSSYDVRQVGGLGKSLGIGEGKKGGIAKIYKDEAKATDELAKALDVNFDEKDPKNQYKIVQKTQEIRDQKQKEIEATRQLGLNNILKTENKIDAIQADVAKNGGIINPKQQVKLDKLNKQLAEEEFTLNASIKNLEDDRDNKAPTIAKAGLKYKNSLKYMQQLERSSKRWSIGGLLGTSAGAGTASLAGTSAATLGVGTGAALLYVLSNASSAKNNQKTIEKRLGKDGTKAYSKEKKKEQLAPLRDALNENEDSAPKDDKKDDE